MVTDENNSKIMSVAMHRAAALAPESPSPPKQFRGRGPLALALVWAATAFHAAAAAEPDTPPEEGFSVELAQSLRWDDNVFRLPDHVAPAPGESRSDRISRTALGLRFDRSYSLQRIVATAEIVQRSFAENSRLDSTTAGGSVRWDWAYGKRWSGTAVLLQREAPRSFADIDRRIRSINTLRRAGFDASYWWHPDWSLVGGVEQTRSRFSDGQSAASEYDETALEAGLGYRPISGNRLALVFRHADGDYPNRSPSATVDSGYTQRDLRLRGVWTATGHSRLSGYVGYTQRTYPNVSRLDFEGPTARLVYDWMPTGKLSLRLVARREIGSEYEVIDNFVVTRGIAIEPRWAVTEKVTASAYAEWLRRDFGGSRVSPIGDDRSRIHGLRLNWEPLRTLTVTLSAQRARRSAANPQFDYTATVYGLDLVLALLL